MLVLLSLRWGIKTAIQNKPDSGNLLDNPRIPPLEYLSTRWKIGMNFEQRHS
ncbi:MAG: hypothetical protein JEY71_03070 [Sphaerochaeta sp.]|nr:hypothetical protein [Sphaerochaeta sp.]